MAPENAETQSASPARSDSVEPAPDSRPVRVSPNVQLESGIPPARERHGNATHLGDELTLEDGVQRMETALANAVRTEANLGLLMRGLKHLAVGAEAARAANTELMHELDELRAELTRSQGEEHALRFRMHQLEQLLTLIRHETTSEREFLIEEQDRFLREVLTDHERQVDELRGRLRETDQSKSEAEQIAELTAQRDQAREYATRCERERDLAWEELATGIAPPTERMQRSPSGAAAIGAISLRSVPVAASEKKDEERVEKRSGTGYSVAGEDIGKE